MLRVVGDRVRVTAQTVATVGNVLPLTQIDQGISTAGSAVSGGLLAAAAGDVGAALRLRVRALDDACNGWAANLGGAVDTYGQIDRATAATLSHTGAARPR